MADIDSEEPWLERMQVISGSLMLASLLQIILGSTGLIGFLMNFVGPLTIAPTVALIGLSLFESVSRAVEQQWGIAILFLALVLFFSLCLGKLKLPLPAWNSQQGCHVVRSPLFKLFPHIIAIIICWLLSLALTLCDVFPSDPNERGYRARTDAKLEVMSKANWFFIPYPAQWGGIKFSSGAFVGFLAAGFSSTIESVGDYYSTARISEVPPPPKHAVNRGIMLEGLASMLGALLGSGHATTSYSATVGFIGITGVASRIIWQVMGVMLIVLGVFGKFGAAVSILPDPIIGGLAMIGFGMVIGVGLSNLQYLDLGSARNLAILGLSLLLGLMVPFWLRANPGIIQTGVAELDQVLTVMLGTGMLVGGGIGFTLDNLIPGTKKERGLISFHSDLDADGSSSGHGSQTVPPTSKYSVEELYAIPFLQASVQRIPCLSYLPFMPTYNNNRTNFKGLCCKRSKNAHMDAEQGVYLSSVSKRTDE